MNQSSDSIIAKEKNHRSDTIISHEIINAQHHTIAVIPERCRIYPSFGTMNSVITLVAMPVVVVMGVAVVMPVILWRSGRHGRGFN